MVNATQAAGLALQSRRLYAGPTIVAIGDSITAADESTTPGGTMLFANGYLTYAMLALGGRLNILNNAGVGGNTSAQMLARFQTDVIALAPKVVSILAGTNDTAPSTQTLPNLTSMIRSALAAGILPILCTIPPAGTATISVPTVTATPSTTGGTLAAATYAYRVSAMNAVGETLASTEVTAAVASGTTGSVVLSWPAVQGATGYKIYGRTSAAELFIAYNNNSGGQSRPICVYTDTGSVTPSGALPGSNTTAVALTTPVRTKICQVNNIVQRLAQNFSLPLVDMYGLLVDPTTGMYQTGYTFDGTHPTNKAKRLMGQLWATTLSAFILPGSPYLARDNSDPTALYANPLFTSNNGTNPTGWGPSSGSAAETITTDAAVAGSVYQTTFVIASPARFNNSAAWSVTAGDKIAFSGMINISNADAGGGLLNFGLKTAGGTQFLQTNFGSDTPSGWCPFYFEAIVPAGTTSIFLYLNHAYAPITSKLAQITVRSLTAQGLT